ncbi:dTDP-4-dehydrorhamnose 3,5-epimerase [Aurantibacillus circumpalustris]|uniref:dTDP-4-dehydrorhamnose 3,5-epimerase n=1 Tax=Aurantibacillus circumpalustris TaxID=3036359 RepID=UPI00295B89C1|nr:dTDP-4-dehydrorhamnose 3,5-epimerase [Aurantibacillus circumpalustris]
MEVIETKLKGLLVLQPKVFEDARGYFFESYNANLFKNAGLDLNFVQDNQSLSQKGVLRGLHFQNNPWAQGKLVRVINGSVFDAAVDIRKSSPTYGQWFGMELNEKNKTMMYIPPGFAHGFATLEDNTIFSYKCTNFYNKASEDCLLWNDPTIGIDWKLQNPLLSEKDLQGKLIKDFVSLFE